MSKLCRFEAIPKTFIKNIRFITLVLLITYTSVSPETDDLPRRFDEFLNALKGIQK